jgi:hypothetical protein
MRFLREYMNERSENSEVPTTMFPYGITLRLDWDSVKMLDKVAMFEREKRATMVRRIVVEKLQVYERNPAFKRFLKQLDKNREEKRLHEETS